MGRLSWVYPPIERMGSTTRTLKVWLLLKVVLLGGGEAQIKNVNLCSLHF
jgi:hypothetical protein